MGPVKSVGQQDVDLYKRIQVAPVVDFDSLAEVIVLVGPDEPMTVDALKAGALILFAALVQVSIASTIEVAEGQPDVVLVLVISIALLRGPVFGAVVGFWAGLVLDVGVARDARPHLAAAHPRRLLRRPPRRRDDPLVGPSFLVAVALGTIGFALGSAVVHFMLGSTLSAGEFSSASCSRRSRSTCCSPTRCTASAGGSSRPRCVSAPRGEPAV